MIFIHGIFMVIIKPYHITIDVYLVLALDGMWWNDVWRP